MNATSAAAVVVGHLIFNARTVISRLAVFVCVCVCVFDDISAGWRLGLLIVAGMVVEEEEEEKEVIRGLGWQRWQGMMITRHIRRWWW